MTGEFNLSKNEVFIRGSRSTEASEGYYKKDVKEFIKRLKEEFKKGFRPRPTVLTSFDDLEPIIDKLAGEKLK